MDELRFEGRVAVVTGAGRGLGRAYALLLARRGAKVVVNDLGGSADGVGSDGEVAEAVVAEIDQEGGAAIADQSDVATAEGAESLIGAAIGEFGRLDVLVTNAGIIRWAGFPEADADNLERHLAVHLFGSFHTARAAWPHLVDQAYGRLVLTTSTGLFGLPTNLSYAAAKGGVVGLARSLATAGADKGITVNLIAPAASTRMAGRAAVDVDDPLSPELVAPMVAFLAHESCPVTGEMYAAGAGRFARLFIAESEGYVDTAEMPTVEDVARNWAAINDETRFRVPTDLTAWSAGFLSHLQPSGRRAPSS